MKVNRNAVLKLIILLALNGMSIFNLPAQEFHHVDVKCFNISLYNEYVNEMNIVVLNLKDTANRWGYKLHALAQGAEINYEQEGDYPAVKLFVLPHQPYGYIHFYLEKNGIYYHVNDSVYFKAHKVNPNDEAFIRIMGISKEHPGNKLKNVKQFVLPKNSKAVNSDFELDGFDIYQLRSELNRNFKVKVRPFLTAVINGTKYYVPQIKNVGKFEIRSTDFKIIETGKNTFNITPTTTKMSCRFEVYLNDKKVTDGSFLVAD